MAHQPSTPPPRPMDAVSGQTWYVSPSQIKTYLSCKYKWHYYKVLGLKTSSSPAAELGSLIHDEIANYYMYGKEMDHPSAKSGVHALKTYDHLKTAVEVELAWPMAPGVVLRGFCDWLGIDGTTAYVIDHKTKNSLLYASSPEELPEDVQMMAYAYIVLQQNEALEQVVVVHNVIERKSPYRAVCVGSTVTREHVEQFGAWLTQVCIEVAADAVKPLRVLQPSVGPTCHEWGGCDFKARCDKDRAEQGKE